MFKKGISLLTVLLLFILSFTVYADGAGFPGVSAQAAVLMEASTGKVLFIQNGDEQLPMASTTKIMTTLLALGYHDLDKEFVVDAEAIHVEGSSMGLMEGDYVSMRDLCYGMLLESGNDAANAAAVALAGDVGSFVQVMNQKAQELGMVNTSFETPSGLDGETHYSTAYDMALLAQAALENPDFLEICSQSSAQLNYGNPPYDRWLKNHNRLLKEVEGCIGVKTGFTKKSGRCLVSAVERDSIRLICVTLNAPDDWNDHKKLYEYGYTQVQRYEFAPDTASLSLPVVGGLESSTAIKSGEALVSFVLTPEDKERLTVTAELPAFLYAPVESGAVVGRLTYKLDGTVIGEVFLHTADSVDYYEKPGFMDKLRAWFS